MISPRRAPLGSGAPATGFTLMEVMIAIVVVGILTAIALPQYNEFVQRSRIIEGTNALNDYRTRMEQFFQDNRTYAAGAACGVVLPPGDAFTLACTPSAAGYDLRANGTAARGMAAFQYQLLVDDAGLVTRSTVGLPAGWTTSATCWVVRKDGSCA
jgi:type IV pilus assembly protein PilE